MTSECYADEDDIVVDCDRPREDGLAVGVTTWPEPDETADGGETADEGDAQPLLGQLAATVPQMLPLLQSLADQREADAEQAERRRAEESGLLEQLLACSHLLTEKVNGLDQQVAELSTRLTSVAATVTEATEKAAEKAAEQEPEPPADIPAEPDVAAASGGGDANLESTLLGESLCRNESLRAERDELIAGVRGGNPEAIRLAGRLMLVQIAGDTELPSLLKEVGEAYYRWRPKRAETADAFESFLVDVLQSRITEVGLRNTIELVTPGDRYDTSRHVTQDRGVEVTEVRGWVVLRENRKPLTKASVGLR